MAGWRRPQYDTPADTEDEAERLSQQGTSLSEVSLMRWGGKARIRRDTRGEPPAGFLGSGSCRPND